MIGEEAITLSSSVVHMLGKASLPIGPWEYQLPRLAILAPLRQSVEHPTSEVEIRESNPVDAETCKDHPQRSRRGTGCV